MLWAYGAMRMALTSHPPLLGGHCQAGVQQAGWGGAGDSLQGK